MAAFSSWKNSAREPKWPRSTLPICSNRVTRKAERAALAMETLTRTRQITGAMLEDLDAFEEGMRRAVDGLHRSPVDREMLMTPSRSAHRTVPILFLRPRAKRADLHVRIDRDEFVGQILVMSCKPGVQSSVSVRKS